MDNRQFNIHSFTSGQQMLHFLQQGSMQIKVMENEQYRWLLFDDYLQTVMDKNHPYSPILPHIHALLLAIYYQHHPKRVVELGLGGGALVRYFNHFFPKCEFISIESQQEVIDTYQQFFCPVQGHQLLLVDAQHALQDLHMVDMLFVDLFSSTGSPDFVYQSSFYQNCLETLSPEGVLIINVVPDLQMQSEAVFEQLSEFASHHPDLLSTPGFKNRVLLYPKVPPEKQLKYDTDLVKLSQQFELNLNVVVKRR